MKRLILFLLLLSAPAAAAYSDWSGPYCRYMYRNHTTWAEYQNWYSHCLWATPPEDAGYDARTGGATSTGGTTATGGAPATGGTTATGGAATGGAA